LRKRKMEDRDDEREKTLRLTGIVIFRVERGMKKIKKVCYAL
jgi:hypothetical protein